MGLCLKDFSFRKDNPPKISRQVIVISGASSGIGLCTARLASAKGAKLLLCSSHRAGLEKLQKEFESRGAQVRFSLADISDPIAMEKLAERAIEDFGKIDTWVNHPGFSLYGELSEISLAQKRELFDVNFWGAIHGCRAALPYLKKSSGCIINVGSALSKEIMPHQTVYSASKLALQAYTEGLRMELEAENSAVVVAFIKPNSILLPLPLPSILPSRFAASKRLRSCRRALPCPISHPQLVAEEILRCAEDPRAYLKKQIFALSRISMHDFMRKTFHWVENALPSFGAQISEKISGQSLLRFPKLLAKSA